MKKHIAAAAALLTTTTGLAMFTAVPASAIPANEATVARQDVVFGLGYGPLGDGTSTGSSTPVEAALPEGVKAASIAAGEHDLFAVTPEGSVYAWGTNRGHYNPSWPRDFSQLGDGGTTDRLTPVKITFPDAATKIVQVSAGNNYGLAVATDGSVYSWGRNVNGQLGDGTTTNRLSPVAVDLPAGVKIKTVAAGWADHSLAVATDGTVYAWGANGSGQLGDGTYEQRNAPVPTEMPEGAKIVDVAVGGAGDSLALAADGTVYEWGGYENDAPTAIEMPGGAKIAAIDAGYDQSLALARDGSIYGWGSNWSGQLGDGTTEQRDTPVKVALPDGVKAAQISAGDYSSRALATDGSVYGWGETYDGQLGDVPDGVYATPIRVTAFDGIATIDAVSFGCCTSFAIGDYIDTDGDGIPNVTDEDDDNDGLTDEQERELGTDPLNPDTDGGGVNDGDEVNRGTDPLNPADDKPAAKPNPKPNPAPKPVAPAAKDTDGDGLSDAREKRLGTNPRKADTDGDGLKDGAEVTRYRTNPLRKDTDRDGLSDGAEVKGTLPYTTRTEGKWYVRYFKTNPLKADTDGDGLSDGAERTHYRVRIYRYQGKKIHGYKTWRVSSNPLRKDTDNDGLSDRIERRRKLDPWDYNTDGWNHYGPKRWNKTWKNPGVIDSLDRFPLNPRKA